MKRLIADGLALYRLAKLITTEDGPFDIFVDFRLYLGRQAATSSPFQFIWRTVADAFTCPHCLGLWLVPVILMLPKWARDLLAIAGLQSLIQERVDTWR